MFLLVDCYLIHWRELREPTPYVIVLFALIFVGYRIARTVQIIVSGGYIMLHHATHIVAQHVPVCVPEVGDDPLLKYIEYRKEHIMHVALLTFVPCILFCRNCATSEF